ncbi:hypothetical protein A5673_04755 [Mycobacterium sp. E3198]|nr:hypothetical protein A5673_04755 [Mycobacterium sp. E3198]
MALALTAAALGGLGAALSVGFTLASHAMTSGCIVDRSLEGVGMLCTVAAGLLGVVAAALALRSVSGPARVRGAHFWVAVAAAVIGAVIAIFCLLWFVTTSGYHAIDPAYLHRC